MCYLLLKKRRRRVLVPCLVQMVNDEKDMKNDAMMNNDAVMAVMAVKAQHDDGL